jgi:hypothetical protein
MFVFNSTMESVEGPLRRFGSNPAIIEFIGHTTKAVKVRPTFDYYERGSYETKGEAIIDGLASLKAPIGGLNSDCCDGGNRGCGGQINCKSPCPVNPGTCMSVLTSVYIFQSPASQSAREG